jgi:hypothetical protein
MKLVIKPGKARMSIASRDKRASKEEAYTPIVQREREIPALPAGDTPVGRLTVEVSSRLSLAWNSMEVTLGIELPVPGLTVKNAPQAFARVKAMLDDEVAKILPEVKEALVTLGEWTKR